VLGIERVSVAAPGEPRESREMQVHAGDQDAVGADAICTPYTYTVSPQIINWSFPDAMR
jgi:hypothetical protein